jgi:hypothetical protein
MTNAIISPIIASAAAVVTGGVMPARATAPAPKPLGRNNIEARFSFNEELAQIVITLRDTNSGEVVRQIPPEKVLQFAEFLLKTTGRILDARA